MKTNYSFFGIPVILTSDEICIAVDQDGLAYAFSAKPHKRGRNYWLASHEYQRQLFEVDLEDMDWKETKMEYKYMNILALDVATKTDWCNNTSSGVWGFRLKRDESSGMRLIRYKAKLAEIGKLERPDLVVY